ncbi:MAG: hypothetical protein R2698_14735 [Microthrixaceae bacterium]
MTTTLTDRYVWAVTRRLPAARRREVAAEVRWTVAALSERVGERQALVELGDPARLADGLHKGRRALIGTVLYPEYVRQLRRWLSVVVPLLAALGGLGAALGEDPTVWRVALGVLDGATTAVLQVCFWTTVVFVLIERFGSGDVPGRSANWTPDDLPLVPDQPRVTVGDTVAELVATGILVSTVFVQRWWSPVKDADGDSIAVLDPPLWSGPMWVVLGLLAAGLALVLAAHAHGSWSWPLASAVAGIDAVLLVLVAWAAFTQRLVNPAFLAALSDEVGRETTLVPNPFLLTGAVGVVLCWDAWEALSSAAKATSPVARSEGVVA